MSVQRRYLTTEEAARYVNVSQKTLENWRCNGEGPKYVRAGKRKISYCIEDLNAWMDQGKVKTGDNLREV